MREWLSGGVSPCQGEGRGFESRLALFLFAAEALIYRVSAVFLCVLQAVDSLQFFRNQDKIRYENMLLPRHGCLFA